VLSTLTRRKREMMQLPIPVWGLSVAGVEAALGELDPAATCVTIVINEREYDRIAEVESSLRERRRYEGKPSVFFNWITLTRIPPEFWFVTDGKEVVICGY
jgi:hypothetical protein